MSESCYFPKQDIFTTGSTGPVPALAVHSERGKAGRSSLGVCGKSKGKGSQPGSTGHFVLPQSGLG